jgi:hypothetical protein
MNRKLLVLTLATGLALAASPLTLAQETSGYKAMAEHYEAIRQALLNDNTQGVAAHAESISQAAATLRENFDVATASIQTDRSADCLEILPEIQSGAALLATTATLQEARDAFGELSTTMVKYRQMLTKPESVVAYCSMAEKAWIQPKGEIVSD